jgi:hypothetical protein
LHVAYTYCATGGGLEAIAAGELDVDAVFVALPLLVGEEAAEVGEAEGYGFVGAEGLGVVGVLDCPVEA